MPESAWSSLWLSQQLRAPAADATPKSSAPAATARQRPASKVLACSIVAEAQFSAPVSGCTAPSASSSCAPEPAKQHEQQQRRPRPLLEVPADILAAVEAAEAAEAWSRQQQANRCQAPQAPASSSSSSPLRRSGTGTGSSRSNVGDVERSIRSTETSPARRSGYGNTSSFEPTFQRPALSQPLADQSRADGFGLDLSALGLNEFGLSELGLSDFAFAEPAREAETRNAAVEWATPAARTTVPSAASARPRSVRNAGPASSPSLQSPSARLAASMSSDAVAPAVASKTPRSGQSRGVGNGAASPHLRTSLTSDSDLGFAGTFADSNGVRTRSAPRASGRSSGLLTNENGSDGVRTQSASRASGRNSASPGSSAPWPRSLSAASLQEAAAAAFAAERRHAAELAAHLEQLGDEQRRRSLGSAPLRRVASKEPRDASKLRGRSSSSAVAPRLSSPPRVSAPMSPPRVVAPTSPVVRGGSLQSRSALSPSRLSQPSPHQRAASPGAQGASPPRTASPTTRAATAAAPTRSSSTPSLGRAQRPVATSRSSMMAQHLASRNAAPQQTFWSMELEPPETPSDTEEARVAPVDVFLRIRPPEARERNERQCIRTKRNWACVDDGSGRSGHWFEFEGIVDSRDVGAAAGQARVFDLVGNRVVTSVLEGFHTCVFSMGQTGTGKTYTLIGTPESPGLLPQIFEELLCRNGGTGARLSCLELHMDRVRDLLADDAALAERAAPEIRCIPQLGVHISNLTEVSVHDAQSAQRWAHTASRQRCVASTGMNATSSRGHAIFQITVASGARLCVVDLAGREQERTTKCRGQTLAELGYINKSLFHLTNVIQALARPKTPRNVVPFRNSKLTMLLSECLQSARTSLVATVGPANSSLDETLSTLRLAQAVRQISTRHRRGSKRQDGFPVAAALAPAADLQQRSRQAPDLRAVPALPGTPAPPQRLPPERGGNADGLVASSGLRSRAASPSSLSAGASNAFRTESSMPVAACRATSPSSGCGASGTCGGRAGNVAAAASPDRRPHVGGLGLAAAVAASSAERRSSFSGYNTFQVEEEGDTFERRAALHSARRFFEKMLVGVNAPAVDAAAATVTATEVESTRREPARPQRRSCSPPQPAARAACAPAVGSAAASAGGAVRVGAAEEKRPEATAAAAATPAPVAAAAAVPAPLKVTPLAAPRPAALPCRRALSPSAAAPGVAALPLATPMPRERPPEPSGVPLPFAPRLASPTESNSAPTARTSTSEAEVDARLARLAAWKSSAASWSSCTTAVTPPVTWREEDAGDDQAISEILEVPRRFPLPF
eukprot:TRINITY_DN15743_c1_g1_i1.p1 TRINITY_DN15743_c1_g1~~TRINITY_DN15743_c1_g1_i1.p1  ORF type:complete len:1308 (-),score=252.25 TRINITY_DN15743_c1_g1_i1:130-4053(-)